jgi:hypothetical protein
MDSVLIDTLLFIWFFVTSLYIFFWIIGNKIRDNPSNFDDEKIGRFLIRVAQVILAFALFYTILIFITEGLNPQTIVGLLISMVALLISMGLFFINSSQKN